MSFWNTLLSAGIKLFPMTEGKAAHQTPVCHLIANACLLDVADRIFDAAIPDHISKHNRIPYHVSRQRVHMLILKQAQFLSHL